MEFTPRKTGSEPEPKHPGILNLGTSTENGLHRVALTRPAKWTAHGSSAAAEPLFCASRAAHPRSENPQDRPRIFHWPGKGEPQEGIQS